MVEEADGSVYVFTKQAVIRSIGKLEASSIHEHFPGYLAILRGTKLEQGNPVRLSAIRDAYERYMRVAPIDDRFLSPFGMRGHARLRLINPNLAGSYSPGTMRGESQPFTRVVEVTGRGQDGLYQPRPGHARLARQHLTKHPVPAAAMAAFLYRDFGFDLEERDVGRVVAIFREEFGFSENDPAAQASFDTLFRNDISEFSAADLEPLRKGSVLNG